ncbi:hypothetical protein ACIRD6_35480 [Streptomyces sp. NPDC102473]|uniref:hypothetical protein n=1 Tax=Streptomyces sp. NPDC102473 TaxID=3366180 RepID=UPI0038044F6A
MTAADLERVDVSVDKLRELVARGVLLAAMTATHSESDRIAYANDLFLLGHPETCPGEKDYPGFAASVARREAENRKYRRAA